MYSVFVKILLANQWNKIVHKHQGDKDAYKVYTNILARVLKYTKAMIKPSKLPAYIKSARVGYVPWSGTTDFFIINWQEQIQIYDNLVEISDHLSGFQECTMLENVVEPIPSL